ncbi:4,5-DOPA dioxygenase extradiol [Cesiribacter sp. SM1]|uniref:4,5-DOPA-extradiol-dioxygenase n=1 Tax=Cesiribacter sp. SM1 TaxID=2861196 RepID=UPI001CD42A9F|nr:4,5-DOPA dioxygenase extradiol [Cesiribacter sp. SM1]
MMTKLKHLTALPEQPESGAMPVLFLGHGSPMNAIEENNFSKGWRRMGESLPKPTAVLCISAHWLTKGTYVTAMEQPVTIHDFGGFPKALFDMRYPAKGDPELALAAQESAKNNSIALTHDWGLDHGAWSVLTHLYPSANVPVVQLSLDYSLDLAEHYKLAKSLASLRKKGVLIMGSGNIVHNLRMLDWHLSTGFDWAIEANEKIKSLIRNRDHAALINYQTLGVAVKLAVPTPDHYLPLIYALALQEENEQASFFNDEAVVGSITMTSVKIDV